MAQSATQTATLHSLSGQGHPGHGSGLPALADRRLFRELSYVDGRWTAAPGAGTLEVLNPADGSLVGRVPAQGAAEATAAVEAAHDAFAAWRRRLAKERGQLLRAWYELIVASKADLARLMVAEQGKPLAEAEGEIDYAAGFVAWYAEEATRLGAESLASHLPGAETSVRREPIGVAALVTPWNFPTAMITRKAAAALAAGCTVVVHPSSETPFSALALAELADRAGLPRGVFNVVTGRASDIVPAWCSDTRVRALSFTGSTEIGRLLGEQCAPTVKQLILELGGHAPFVVFADADLDRAVESCLSAKFATSGQDCLAANRIYVERPVYQAFVARFVDQVRTLKVGPGLEPGVEIGPLIHDRAVAKMAEQVEDATAKGAKLLVGGKSHALGGQFFEPTVLADAPDTAKIMSEETFGPIAALAPFDSEEEAIARANDTEYGLIAYLHSGDRARIARVVAALEYGMVAVNRTKVTGAPVPFGGVKQSGLAREGGRAGIEAFTELKYVCTDLD